MKNVEINPNFSNMLVHSSSPYLRQHAHNPVFWYPWGKEALDRAKKEQKPILLSIGYSSCYWCHVMEREVFENVSIAALMNRTFINIKIDREEHPELDDIYMTARQLLRGDGGWPNNVFLTPDLKPFYAGGTYFAEEAPNRPSFPRVVEWLHHSWSNQRDEVEKAAQLVVEQMHPHLVYKPSESKVHALWRKPAEDVFASLEKQYDERSGGFFQAPKFPHETYLQFLAAYNETTGSAKALNMLTRSLGKMAAGGLQDHVGCGFHRYAVDKEWYIPHFEKMLYNQAQLARLYTDAARLSQNAYYADVARSILDFVSGPLTSPQGAFYAAIDAETDGVEGAYYVWNAEQFAALLSPAETKFISMFYALADIPQYPGHKHPDGQVLIARKPLDQAAQEHQLSYMELAAMNGQLMNHLLVERNKRAAPRLDDKILTGWNGLMIDAFAHASKIFSMPVYAEKARKAANFILEHVIDNDGNLKRLFAGGKAQLPATLDDYAYVIKGLLSLYKADNDKAWLASAVSLAARVQELFSDGDTPGYFHTQATDEVLIRAKTGGDSSIPSGNAVMLHNWLDIYSATKEKSYLDKATAMAEYFVAYNNIVTFENATLMSAVLRLSVASGETEETQTQTQSSYDIKNYATGGQAAPEKSVKVKAALFPLQSKPGAETEVLITLDIQDGWHINANRVNKAFLIPTQIEVQGKGITVVRMQYPEPRRKESGEEGAPLLVYEGLITCTAYIRMPASAEQPNLKIMLRFQPCQGNTCYAVKDKVITL